MKNKLIASLIVTAALTCANGPAAKAESTNEEGCGVVQTRATFGECVQEPVTPPAPAQFFPMPMPSPAPQINPKDTLPGGNIPGGPGWFPPTGDGGGQVDETEVRLFSMESLKGLVKDLRKTFKKSHIPFKSFLFVEESKEGGSVFEKEGAVLFKKGRYDVAEKELPAILMKDANGKHVFAVSNYNMTKEQIIQDVEKTFSVKANQK